VTKGGNTWGVGPYNVLMDATVPPGAAAPLPTALDPYDHLLLIDTAVAPPPEACDPAPVTGLPFAAGEFASSTRSRKASDKALANA